MVAFGGDDNNPEDVKAFHEACEDDCPEPLVAFNGGHMAGVEGIMEDQQRNIRERIKRVYANSGLGDLPNKIRKKRSD